MPSWNAGAKSSIRTGLGGPKLSLGTKRPSLPESGENINETAEQDQGDDRSSKRQKVEHEKSIPASENVPQGTNTDQITKNEEQVEATKAVVSTILPNNEAPVVHQSPAIEVEDEDDIGIVINVASDHHEPNAQADQPVDEPSHVRTVTFADHQSDVQAGKQPDVVSTQIFPVEIESETDSESDSDAVPSLEEDDSEDSSNSSNSSDEDDENSDSEDDDEDESMIDESEAKPEGDALQIYSSSNPAENAIDLTQDTDHPLTIASLSYEDLILQIRYFHVGRSLSSIDATTPVRCLTCAAQGHMASSCPAFKCNTCRSNEHMGFKCPSFRRCSKCRQQGHDETSCSAKLKLPMEQIVCSLCEAKGHFEDECETIWRTSIIEGYGSRTSEESTVRLFCYECSSGGHLGNDCPTRQPRKPLGSSSWTTKGHYGSVLRRDALPPPKSSGPKTAPLPIANNSKQRVKAVPVSKATSIQIKGFAGAEDDDEYEPPPLIVTQHHNAIPHAAGSTSLSVKGAAKGAARQGQQNQKGAIKINIEGGGNGGKGKGKGR